MENISMPNIAVLVPFCLLQIFIHSHASHAMELAAEFNPQSKLFKMSSGLGMIGLYGFIAYGLFFLTPWYSSIILFLLGLFINSVVFNLIKATGSQLFELGLVFLGFVGIPVCIILVFILGA